MDYEMVTTTQEVYVCQACKKDYKKPGNLFEHQKSKCKAYPWFSETQRLKKELEILKQQYRTELQRRDQILSDANTYVVNMRSKAEKYPQLTWENNQLKTMNNNIRVRNTELEQFIISKMPNFRPGQKLLQ